MLRLSLFGSGLLALSLITTTPTLSAARLFGTTGAGTSAISTLVELDPTTGALIQTIGSTGFSINGLTYDSTTGTLYGSTGGSTPSLLAINMTTGAATVIGPYGFGPVVTIASNSSGSVYGWWEPSDDDLVSINTATGAGTVVGESGLGTGGHGLAFDAAGVLYLVNFDGSTYTIDTTTGASTLQGTIGTQAHHGDFDPVSGLYYGIDTSGNGSKNLVLANMSTFATSTLPTVDDLHTLTFVDGEVPEPGTLLMLGTGFGAFLLFRRRSA